MRIRRIFEIMFLLTIIAFLILIGGCTGGSSTTSGASTPPATSISSQVGPTFGSNGDSGKVIFSSICAQCHGANGQGITAPAVIGANANLGKYGTAKGLLDFISTAMPLSAPGSLTHQDYINVLCYLLIQNNYANSATPFNENALPGVQLK